MYSRTLIGQMKLVLMIMHPKKVEILFPAEVSQEEEWVRILLVMNLELIMFRVYEKVRIYRPYLNMRRPLLQV
jgi:hypothetical protein